MTRDAACCILQQMLEGIDPITGEYLPEDHFCHDPTVIRAMHTAVMALMDTNAPHPLFADPEDAALTRSGRLRADRPWTEEDDRALMNQYRPNADLRALAWRMQRRERGLERRLRYLGLLPEKESASSNGQPGLERAGKAWTHEEDNLLRAMYKEHQPVTAMAERLHRTQYAIACRMEKLNCYGDEPGYPQQGAGPWTLASVDMLKKLHAEGLSLPDIAAHFGRSEASVSAKLFYLGLSKESPIRVRF